MAERYPRPDWVRRLNLMGDSLGGPSVGARRLVPIDPDAIYEEAVRSLGLEAGELAGDFGDPRWRERFDALARCVDAAPMTVVGRLLTRQEIFRALRTRLLQNRAWAEDAGIARETIAAPLVVTGPARSGTTILFELLWLDPNVRAPLAWEALHPLPMPEGDANDVRLRSSECEQELWADVQPEFAAIHELRSDLPVECVTLTQPCFAGSHWLMISQLERWLPDMVETYAYEKRALQLLQRGREPKTWLLKTPGHVMTLDLLFSTFPDARVIQTHRDPAKTMPSTVSTTAMVQWMRADDVDLDAMTVAVRAVFTGALNAVATRRAEGSLPARQFGDVHFQDLLKDPVDAIRRAYDQIERPFTKEHAEAIVAYLAAKPKGKFGVHKYAPEDWGFTAKGLRDELAPYLSHFRVALE